MDNMSRRYLAKQGVIPFFAPNHWELEDCVANAIWDSVKQEIERQDDITRCNLRTHCAIALRHIGVSDLMERWNIAQSCIDLTYGMGELDAFEKTFQF